jgi:hypothetical protein
MNSPYFVILKKYKKGGVKNFSLICRPSLFFSILQKHCSKKQCFCY